jgi:uncharacterized membrane protein YhiD involved in acid resistance
MAASVASGVGFLGAGVITNNRKASGVYDQQSSVRGLTTAASIWVAAGVGVACGCGLFTVGLFGGIAAITILRFGITKQRIEGREKYDAVAGSLSSNYKVGDDEVEVSPKKRYQEAESELKRGGGTKPTKSQ